MSMILIVTLVNTAISADLNLGEDNDSALNCISNSRSGGKMGFKTSALFPQCCPAVLISALFDMDCIALKFKSKQLRSKTKFVYRDSLRTAKTYIFSSIARTENDSIARNEHSSSMRVKSFALHHTAGAVATGVDVVHRKWQRMG